MRSSLRRFHKTDFSSFHLHIEYSQDLLVFHTPLLVPKYSTLIPKTFCKKTFLAVTLRVVNRFWKRSLNDRFSIRFSIVFKNDRFVFGKKRSFLKTTHSFWTFRKRITIVFENDRFFKNDKRPFFIRLFFTKRSLTKGRR